MRMQKHRALTFRKEETGIVWKILKDINLLFNEEFHLKIDMNLQINFLI